MADEQIGLRLDIETRGGAVAKAGLDQYRQAIQATASSTVQLSRSTQQFIAQAGMMGAAVNRGGTHGAQGLMMLAQTIDDAQYGFRAIVNNIPTMTQAMAQGVGVSATSALKLGGALGIAAVAANLNIQRANEWKVALDGVLDSIPGVQTLTTTVQQLASAANDVAVATLGWDFSGDSGGIAAARAGEEARVKAGNQGRTAIEGVRTQEEQQRAKLFVEAVQKEGGGESVRQRYLDAMLSDLSTAQREEKVRLASGEDVTRGELRRRTADETIARAMRGDASAIGAIGSATGSSAIGGIDREMQRAESARRLEARQKQIDDAMEGIARPAEDAAVEVKQAYNQITVAMREHGIASREATLAQDAYTGALIREAQAKREAAAETAALVIAEQNLARQAQEAMARKQNELSRQTSRDTQIYGQIMGGGVANAMLRAGMRGEDTTEVDARMRRQVMDKLTLAGVDEKRRADIAANIVGGARQQVDDYQADQQARMFVMREAFGSARMGARTRMDVAAVQQLERSLPPGVTGRGQEPVVQAAQKQENAATKFDKSVDRFEGIVRTGFQAIL